VSDEGRLYVKKFSPFTGSTFWLHYIFGDIANKDHDYEIFISNETIKRQWPFSDRSIDRGRSDLAKDRFVTTLVKPSPGVQARYRFNFIEVPENGRCLDLKANFPLKRTLANLADDPTLANLATHVCQSGDSRLPKVNSSPITNRIGTEALTLAPISSEPVGPRRDLLFEAVAAACGTDLTQLTKSARGQLNRAVSELRSIGANPAEVTIRASRYRTKFRDADLTSTALAKHWPSLGHDQTAGASQSKSRINSAAAIAHFYSQPMRELENHG
jgi:hypothetical protein